MPISRSKSEESGTIRPAEWRGRLTTYGPNYKKEDPMKVKPLGDRVLVQPEKENEVRKGGIIIPDTAKEKPQQGKVIEVGTGKRDEDGKIIPFNVKKGDRVLMPKYGGTEIKLDDVDYVIIREEDILGVLE